MFLEERYILMITVIRRSFKSKAYKIILWITIFALAGIFSLPSLFKRMSGMPWIVSINGQEIGYNDYVRKTAIHQEFLNNLRAKYGQYADAFFQTMGITDPKTSAMNELLQESLLNQAADKLGIVMSADHIADKLANPLFVQQELASLIPAGAMDQFGGINMPILKKYLQRLGLSINEFESKVSEAVQRSLISELVRVSTYTPEFAVKQFYAAHFMKKKYSMLTLSLAAQLKAEQAKKVSQEELKAFFDVQPRRYMVPEKRDGVVWRIEPRSYGVSVAAKEIEEYYEEIKAKKYVDAPALVTIRHILIKAANEAEFQAAFEKAKKLKEELDKAPQRFAELAKEVSQDQATATEGGLMKPFARGTLQEREIEKAAFILKQDGDISDIVQTAQGFELVQRVQKTEQTYKSLASVSKDIEAIIIQQKFGELFNKDMAVLLERAQEPNNSLENELKAKGAVATPLTAIVSDDETWGQSLFGLQKIGESTYYVEKGVGEVVQLSSIKEAYVPTLEAVAPAVTNDLYQERALHAMEDTLKKIQAEVTSGKSLKDLKAVYGGSLEALDWISPDSADMIAELRKKNISVESLFQLEKVGSVTTSFEGKDGFVFRADEIEEFNQAHYDMKKAEVKKQLENQEVRLLLAGFVASLYRSATIKHNELPTSISEENIPYEE